VVSYINMLTDTFGGPQRIRRDQLSPSLLATAQFCQTDHPGTVVRRSSLNRISMAIVRSSLRSRWTSYRAVDTSSNASVSRPLTPPPWADGLDHRLTVPGRDARD